MLELNLRGHERHADCAWTGMNGEDRREVGGDDFDGIQVIEHLCL